jgi:hypothetical protein
MPYRRKRGRRVNVKGRSEGEQYVNLPYAMLLSRAWLSLSGSAARLWLLLRTRFNGGNNGKLTLSLEEAANLLHMSKATVFAAFAELEEKGFVVCAKRGQWYGRLASEWAVGDKGVNGAMPTYAWRQWSEKSGPLPPQKTERGTDTEPSGVTTVRQEYRSKRDGSATVPVSGLNGCSIGTDTDR